MSLSDELAYTSAAELARRVRSRDLSPVEIVDAFLERIEARNPGITAFVHVAAEDARSEAKRAEREVMAGDALGPLHGIPTAIKDLNGLKPGWPGTFGGIRAFSNFVADRWCPFAERMERAGAIHLGLTNSPVFGFRGTCDNYLFGPSRNPFDTRRNTGGSSGGSAGAVADGLLPLAQGTDGGGSIRIPSSWSGVYGFKASAGRLPHVARPNAFNGSSPFLFDGAITRTVEDSALALTVLAGYDSRDPFSLDEEIDWLGATRRSIRGMKVAYSPNLDVFPVDPRVAEVVATAVRAFEEAGAHVEEVEVGIRRSQRELSDLWCRLIMANLLLNLEVIKERGIDLLGEHPDDLPPEIHAWIETGKRMTIHDVIRDQAVRTEVYDAVQGVLDTHDLLVTPSLACLPVENADDGNTVGPTEVNGEAIDPLIGWCLTYPINFTGHPAASVPAGLADGLPVGMQIVGGRHADVDVLAASAVFERLRPWQDRYEICRKRETALPPTG
ncbi:MAG: amidase family protein [Immundisolibacterales bacterium]|nr:amidase family protein [Immundisolibacterales bacterium]